MTWFFTCSILVGAIQIIDAILLYKSHGQTTKFSSVTSLLEFFWVIACFYALTTISFSMMQTIIPLAYIVYNIIGWLYGFILIKNSNLDTLKVPLFFVTFGGIFGFIYLVVNAIALNYR